MLPRQYPVRTMRSRGLCVLALSLLCAAPSLYISVCANHCDTLYNNSITVPVRQWMHAQAPVRLEWGEESAGAAAAVLRAVLLAAGTPPAAVTLHRSVAARRLCDLLDTAQPEPLQVVVAPATTWSPEERRCTWGQNKRGDNSWLRPQGVGAAPAGARLHVRLSRDAADDPECSSRDWSRESNGSRFVTCGFSRVNIIYADEAYEVAAKKVLDRFGLQPEKATRARLEELLADDTASFLFVDADLWRGERRVRLADGCDEPPATSILLADEYRLRVSAPRLYDILKKFALNGTQVRNVLRRAAADDLRLTSNPLEEAGCAWVDSEEGKVSIPNWSHNSSKLRWAFVGTCDNEYDDTEVVIQKFFDEPQTMEHVFYAVDCSDPNMTQLVSDFEHYKTFEVMSNLAYMAMPDSAAAALARDAESFGVPLLAYEPTTAAGVRSTSGDVALLARALRDVLTACGWGRVALLSSGSRLADGLARELLSDTVNPLCMQNEPISTKASIVSALESLRDADARVIVVNAEADAAADVLSEAVLHAMTPEAGYVWLVREYGEPDNCTRSLRPYRVSTQRRGECRTEWQGLCSKVARRWWPHIEAIGDALLVLRAGFRRLEERHPALLRYPPDSNKLRLFWDGLKNQSVLGIRDELNFDEGGALAATAYVQRWGWADPGTEPAPGDCPAGSPPPSDGTTACVWASGGCFHPQCHDAAWAGTVAAAALLTAVAAVLAVWRARALLRSRELKLRAKCEARMLARWESAFASLESSLVRRAALELREELGAGRFGRVRLGLLRTPGRDRPQLVAVKSLRESADPAEEAHFLREACALAALRHDHVVRFVGACVEDGPPLLLMEYAFFGDLRRYLRRRRHLAEGARSEGADVGEEPVGGEEAAYVSAEALTRLAHEAAAALAYLAARGLVHRDVRAANCLVDARRALKLADFGLARDTGEPGGEYACRSRALFPVLWMAPESLARGVCSPASDVWAFGVLALEVVTLGARPYGDAAPEAVLHAVLAGGRPPLPRDATPDTRGLLRACWRRAPDERPAAAQLARWLAAAGRRRALRPALARQLHDVDADSGFGEPLPPPLPQDTAAALCRCVPFDELDAVSDSASDAASDAASDTACDVTR